MAENSCYNEIYNKLLEVEADLNLIDTAVGASKLSTDSHKTTLDTALDTNLGAISTLTGEIEGRAQTDETTVPGEFDNSISEVMEALSLSNHSKLNTVAEKSKVTADLEKLAETQGNIAANIQEINTMLPEGGA